MHPPGRPPASAPVEQRAQPLPLGPGHHRVHPGQRPHHLPVVLPQPGQRGAAQRPAQRRRGPPAAGHRGHPAPVQVGHHTGQCFPGQQPPVTLPHDLLLGSHPLVRHALPGVPRLPAFGGGREAGHAEPPAPTTGLAPPRLAQLAPPHPLGNLVRLTGRRHHRLPEMPSAVGRGQIVLTRRRPHPDPARGQLHEPLPLNDLPGEPGQVKHDHPITLPRLQPAHQRLPLLAHHVGLPRRQRVVLEHLPHPRAPVGQLLQAHLHLIINLDRLPVVRPTQPGIHIQHRPAPRSISHGSRLQIKHPLERVQASKISGTGRRLGHQGGDDLAGAALVLLVGGRVGRALHRLCRGRDAEVLPPGHLE